MQPLVKDLLESFGTPRERQAYDALTVAVGAAEDESLVRTAIDVIWQHASPEQKQGYIYSLLENIHVIPEHKPYLSRANWIYRGCGESPETVAKYGFSARGKSTSVFLHKIATGSSIFVSCSKSLQIALEHAQQFGDHGYIYRLRPENGVDCAAWFHPVREIHPVEREVIFPHTVPPEKIHSYSTTKSPKKFVPLHL